MVRKILGYAHILQFWAIEVSTLNRNYLTPYFLAYHRLCFFAETEADGKGKERKKYLYKNMMTTYDKFLSIANYKQYLKEGVMLEKLKSQVSKQK